MGPPGEWAAWKRLPANAGGAPGRIRTCDTRFRRAVLYPLSYEGGAWLEPSLETSLQGSL